MTLVYKVCPSDSTYLEIILTMGGGLDDSKNWTKALPIVEFN
jgi:inosine-uridine nucleoside N-ribohydrolase